MKKTVTPPRPSVKKEAFARAYVELGNASKAFRVAYSASTANENTIHRRAYDLMSDAYVVASIDRLRAEAAAEHRITVADLLNELEQARVTAMNGERPNASAAVAATMGKAKLLGMDIAKVQLSGANGGPIETAARVVSITTDDPLMAAKAYADLMCGK